MSTLHHIGLDVGSRTTKAALLIGDQIAARVVKASQWDTPAVVREVLQELAAAVDLRGSISSITPFDKYNARIFATGFGRSAVAGAARTVTEITCHARGAWHLQRGVRSVIDIGGQDAKVINLDASGFPCDFAMNDRCAAGTGRFLEFMALALEMSVEEMAQEGLSSDSGVRISSMCTVFAESEMLSLRAAGHPRPDVICGLHAAIARRIASLAGQIGIQEPVLFTGGVAHNPAMVRALQEALNLPLIIPPEPVLVGALGAALLSQEEN